VYTTFGQPLTGRPRLICYPYAGAGAGIYHDWAGRLPGVDLVAARLPGRDSLFREPAITDFSSLIGYLLDGIWVFTGVPFILFGHSMGGLLGYELARRMQEAGKPPALLIAAATDAPQSFDVGCQYGDSLDDASLLAAMRRDGGTPDDALANVELMRLMLPIMRADIRMLASYRYRPSPVPLAVPVRLYRGADDEPGPERLKQEWEAAVAGPVAEHEFPGGHFFLHSARPAVIETLASHIDEAISYAC
jgi:medium-chain acyl-[acyl-carrier-protein] hydrolase